MAARFTDAQTRALVRKAIAYAEEQASTDQEFVQILRATYFTEHPDVRRQLPVTRRRSSLRAKRGPQGADPGFHIWDDPRFLANARLMAQRVSQNLRIMGGSKVSPADFPDCVAVGDDDDWQCTGTLIAPRVVISAGHCASVATRVYFGTDVRKKGKEIGVARAVRHPKYHKSKRNDLLVLVLEKNATAKPRKIASTAAINKATDGRAVGFGNVDASGEFGYGTKRQVDLPIASPSCSGRANGQSDSAAYGCDRTLEMVAGKPMLGRDSCSGDSGGPFYISDGRKGWLLAGATSRSTDSAMTTCGDGGIYARIDQYIEWIEDSAKVKLR